MIRRLAFVLLLSSPTLLAQTPPPAAAITPSWIEPHVRFLSDGTLEGRDTGSREYAIAANYVAAQFELLGLTPAGDGASYFQSVPIRKASVAPGSASLVLHDSSGDHALQFDRDFFVHASGAEDGVDASAPVVFVGFGVTAPDRHYDDYAGIDVRGKIVAFLPGTPSSLPNDVRAVESLSGRRVRNAHAHGAVAVILLNPQTVADALREKAVRQQDATMWLDEAGQAHSLEFGGGFAILPKDATAALLRNQPLSMSEINERLKKGPASFDLHTTATLHARFEHRDLKTVNVAALLAGTATPREYVIYTAHLDHDGVSTFFPGDHVLHGALDNAGGIATILAVARAFTQAPAPRRSILFVAVTGEEKGLVGSDYFVHHPTVPREAIAADINCDNFLWYVPVRDISGVGEKYSSLHEDFAAAAARMHLPVSDVPAFGPHLFVGTDHFSFVSAGIPAVSIMNGLNSGDGTRNGLQIWIDYMRNVHHTPKDTVDQELDWSAAVDEARFAFALGEQVANDAERPRLNGSAFFAPRH